MKNEKLTQIFKSLCFPEKKLKSIKLKRFLREMNEEIDFRELDIFIAGLHDNYSDKKVTLESFGAIVGHLAQRGELTPGLISEKFEETLSDQEE